MLSQFITIGLLMLFTAMLPGPDFALVTKNTLLHSRRSGLFTTLGIACALLVHISYCGLGLAVIIAKSPSMFMIIKYIGASYLIYLGFMSLKPNKPTHHDSSVTQDKKLNQSSMISFQQGFFCNLLNPKVTLFFLALFTIIIKPDTSSFWIISYAVEMVAIVVLWFYSLILILSHPKISQLLERAEKYIEKLLGLFLIVFGLVLVFA
jgi:RhtB (resistance to homoserine/threonine) family protein